VVEQLLPTAGDGCMPGAGRSLREVRRRVEREWIVWALREAGGVKTRAAELLGMKEAALRKRIKALGISPGKQ
jgi:DNA-binding NtrC family response regulator